MKINLTHLRNVVIAGYNKVGHTESELELIEEFKKTGEKKYLPERYHTLFDKVKKDYDSKE